MFPGLMSRKKKGVPKGKNNYAHAGALGDRQFLVDIYLCYYIISVN